MTFPWLLIYQVINNKINQMINQRVDSITSWGIGQELVVYFDAGELVFSCAVISIQLQPLAQRQTGGHARQSRTLGCGEPHPTPLLDLQIQ